MDLNKPLAYRMRPNTLEEYVGQEHLLGKNKILSNKCNNSRSFRYKKSCRRNTKLYDESKRKKYFIYRWNSQIQ